MEKVVVLGAGLVGREMARDLARDYAVTAVDRSEAALAGLRNDSRVTTAAADLSDPRAIQELVKDQDVVVAALPGHIGRRALEAVIDAGKDVVDIGFFPEDCFELDELAKARGVTAIVDMGVAPGMSNVLAGHHHSKMLSMSRFECLVGGLPAERQWPFEYKAVFSPADVFELYTRPARYLENGQEVVRPALTDVELLDFEGVGTLEAFNTDGLRTLAQTIKAPNMKEKTLRYPGHARLMQTFRDTGFFDKTPREIGGAEVSPLAFTSELMMPFWKLEKGAEEFTVMRVTIEGLNAEARPERVVYDLLDRFDRENGVTSMARTTGYTATGAVRLLTKRLFTRKGICPPEFVGESEVAFDALMKHLEERNVIYKRTITSLDKPRD
jgi:saccharopine dehydrogenase-like NADP-dependent oxidoreductase